MRRGSLCDDLLAGLCLAALGIILFAFAAAFAGSRHAPRFATPATTAAPAPGRTP